MTKVPDAPLLLEGPIRSADKAVPKKQILADIAAHIREHGRTNWNLVRERPEYAAIIGKAAGDAGKRKFWRWVNAVSRTASQDEIKPHQARAVAVAASSPTYFMAEGAQAAPNIDFVAEMHVLFRVSGALTAPFGGEAKR